jgi:adenylate kinase family enzyme
MRAVDRIHIFGASGSGTSTLGSALAERFGYAHLDSDSFLWEPTDPPFQRMREAGARRRMLAAALDAHPRWVLTGSLCGLGDVFIPRFDLVVFLVLPHELRMERLMRRERQRYGAEALAPGGPMHQHHEEFIAWATAYDTADESMRSLRLHEKWLAALPCPTVRLDGPLTVEEQIDRLCALASSCEG